MERGPAMCVLSSPYAEGDHWESGSQETALHVVGHPTRSSCTGMRSLKKRRWWQGGHPLGNDPGGRETEPAGVAPFLCSDTTAGRALSAHVYKVSVAQGGFSASYTFLGHLHFSGREEILSMQISVHPSSKDSAIHQNADPNLERAHTGQVLQ